MEQPELKNDPRFIDVKSRVANHDDLFKIVSSWTKKNTVEEIDKKLNDAGCPASIVNTIDRLVVDKQIAGAREMFPEIEQPGIGKLQITACPQKLTRTKSYPRKSAPLLGEDNMDIFGKLLGFSEDRINELKSKGII